MALNSLSQQESEDLSAVHFSTDAWAQTVTYNGTDISAILVEYTKDDNRRDTAKIQVRAADVAAPDYRDTVVISGDTWTVKRWTEGDGIAWEILLEKSVRPGFER